MLVASTAQLALGQECWVEGCTLWRVQQHAFAARQEAGSPRRLEVVVDGLPLFGGAQLAVDTTLVCALHAKEGGDPWCGVGVEPCGSRRGCGEQVVA